MIKWFNDPVPEYTACAITMGNFDGLHLGHRKVLSTLTSQAKAHDLSAVVLTYWEHPGHFVHFQHQVPILTPRLQKRELLEARIEGQVYFLNFNSETAHIPAAGFLSDVIIRYFHPKIIVTGYDSHFGYRREGNADFLQQREAEFGYATIRVEPVYYKNGIISSSAIREALSRGEIRSANAMLGEPYTLYGTVSHGSKLGRTIGFPTLNLNPADNEQLIPKNGVYLSKVIFNGNAYFGLTNIGISPTLKYNGQIEIETHVFDFNRDIYSEEIRLQLLDYIRDEIRFPTVHDLQHAIKEDIKKGKKLLAGL
jgi:riboflavin kinase/FMN adenylyltransferase